MLEFTLENLQKVNRVVVRYEEQRELTDNLEDIEPPSGLEGRLFETIRDMLVERLVVLGLQGRPDLHISLYADRTQIAFGAPRQTTRRNGEFTTDTGGLKLTLMFLEQITGQNFKGQLRAENSDLEEYHRSDLRVVKMKPDLP